MELNKNDKFTYRQTMDARDFEFHYYKDVNPPDVDFHQHPFFEVFFFISGNVDYIIEGKIYRLRPGDILLTNNSDIHRPVIKPGKPYERIVIWLGNSFISSLHEWGDDLTSCFRSASSKQYQLIRPSTEKMLQMRSLCSQILIARDKKEFGSRSLMYANLIRFLVLLNKAYFDNSEDIKADIKENEKINLVIAFINEHSGEDLSLEMLASHFYISKYYLDSQFKKYTGMPVYQFIMKKRLITARNLLRSGVPVIDACMKSGFNDYSNFLKAFKREFNKTPKEYIRASREDMW